MPLNTVAPIQRFVRAAFSRSRPAPWVEEVRGVIADLEDLNKATETDFLKVGGHLMEFLSSSRGLHTEIVALTSASGEQARAACDALVSVLGYVREMQRRSDEGSRALLVLKTGADSIRLGFSTFGQIVTSFRITAIAAKIEVAQLATSLQNLESLAEDVRSCIEEIEALGARILEAVSAFDSRVASTLREVSQLEGSQLHEVSELLAEVSADLDAFQHREREAAGISSKVAEELDSVVQELGAVAVSIQFHDITRQQVEHAILALQDLARAAPERPLSSSGGASAMLQKAQLRGAAVAFAKSTNKIDLELRDIAAKVTEMASDGGCMKGVGEEGKASFFGGMQGRFTAIAGAVAELDSLARGTQSTFADLRNTSAPLSGAVQGLQAIEARLSRVAINAMISACHIGPRGDALHVIAGAIQGLKMECASRSGDAQEALDSIGKVIDGVLAGDTADAGDAFRGNLVEVLKTRIGELQSASASSADATAKVLTQAENLRAGLRDASDGFHIGQVFADTIARCCDRLDRIASEAQPSKTPGASVVEEMAENRYTMESERNVHRASMMGAVGAPEEGGPDDLSKGREEEVEFF